MSRTANIFHRLRFPLVLGFVFSCSQEVPEIEELVVCSSEDLFELQELCLEYGGSYRGESTLDTVTGCTLTVAVDSVETSGEFAGECYFISESECVTICKLPSDTGQGDGD